ncbi:helix-turn-helix domain-containing protein [Rhodococcus sp. NPDC047139]|uniref:helix-turn-helix transcriptional regulator n=1 Tax=Rhodococcus sp. NPDC047139 TaxID=3155141 RepID=UPI0033F96673
MNTVEAAEYLGRTPRTLAQWRHYREGPTYLKGANGRVTYRQDDLDEWKRHTAPAEALVHLSEADRLVIDALG